MADTTPPIRVEIVGLLSDVSFTMARFCAEDLNKTHPDVFSEPEVTGLLEFEWNIFVEEKKKELRGETWVFDDQAIIFVNGHLVGGPESFIMWAEHNHGYQEFRPDALYETLTEEAYKGYLNARKHDYVFMDLTIGDEPAGRLVIELFSDQVPKTCANFKALCTGEKGETEDGQYKYHYLKTILHRIVHNGWIQGGDIYYGRGNGGESIHGKVFEDENFSIKHSRRGIMGMANKGRHTNGSQFYITLQPAPWMDTKYVAFGQVIEGTETLKKLESQETMNERPMIDLQIAACGVLTYEF